MLDVKRMQQPKALYSLEIHKAGSIFLQMYMLVINIKSLPVFLNIKLLKQNIILILMGEVKMKSTIEGLMIIILIILFAIGQILNI